MLLAVGALERGREELRCAAYLLARGAGDIEDRQADAERRDERADPGQGRERVPNNQRESHRLIVCYALSTRPCSPRKTPWSLVPGPGAG